MTTTSDTAKAIREEIRKRAIGQGVSIRSRRHTVEITIDRNARKYRDEIAAIGRRFATVDRDEQGTPLLGGNVYVELTIGDETDLLY